jgi:hypothetical protein
MRTTVALFVSLALAMTLDRGAHSAAYAQTGIEYQDRGDRYEGVRPRPVSNYDIELISARADYEEPAASLPPTLKVRFFLPDAQQVNIVVRELEFRQYYWLDRAQPRQPWRRGFDNEFAWPSDAVLGRLPQQVSLSDLGVVARLGGLEPSADERVAPAILYHTRPPRTVTAYLLVFKTASDARLVYRIFRDGESTPLVIGEPLRPRAGRPFLIHWDAARAGRGIYRVVLEGFTLDANRALQQTVRFAHEPQAQ